jgi:N-acetylglucosamine-6-sulfatase
MGYDALRTDRWKLIHFRELSGADELYDLRQDPYEMNNLVDAPDAQGVKADLRKRLDAAVEAAR